MSIAEHLVGLFRSLRREERMHRRQRDVDLLDLQRRQAEMELDMEALKRRRLVELEFELERFKRQQQMELIQLEKKLEQDLQDYERYLAAVDRLQEQLRQVFSHAPEVIVLTIHHHAKQLLDKMWEAEELNVRIEREREFVKFLTTVYEDTIQAQNEKTQLLLPQRALRLMLEHRP